MPHFWNSTKFPVLNPCLLWVFHLLHRTKFSRHWNFKLCVNHVLPYMLSPLWKEGPISSSCHSFRIQHIPLPGDILSIRRFSVLGSLHFKYFWLKYCVDMEYNYVHYPLSPLYCGKFLERRAFGKFISISQNLAHCLTA